MQIRNIRPHSQHVPGDVVEVPDGAAFDPFHWEAADGTAGTQAGVEADTQAIPAAATSAPRLPIPPKEM